MGRPLVPVAFKRNIVREGLRVPISLLRRKNMWEGHRVPCHYERRPPGPIMLKTRNMRESFCVYIIEENPYEGKFPSPLLLGKEKLHQQNRQKNPCSISKPHASLI